MSRFDRRKFVASSLLAAASASPLRALAQPDGPPPGPAPSPRYSAGPQQDDDHYTPDEVVHAGSSFLGVTAEAIGAAVERITRDNGSSPPPATSPAPRSPPRSSAGCATARACST